MPTVRKIGPYRLYFYANDRSEPVHVHVERERFHAKFWVSPIRLAENQGFRPNEIIRLQKLIHEYQDEITERWNEYFNS